MAPNVSQILSCVVFLLFLVLPILSHAKEKKPSSPFKFIKHLQGCRKGDKVKGLNHLKNYLKKFGYIKDTPTNNSRHVNNDDFDDVLESAIKTYQTFRNLNSTGVLDAKTVLEMMRPRCGVPDIRIVCHPKSHCSSHVVPHYSFLDTKWPAYMTHLTYGFAPDAPTFITDPVARAFGTWASVSNFQFSQGEYESANLKIGFYSGDHGDDNPFDGPRGVVGHAFTPTDGRFHYDADEYWVIGAIPNGVDLESVALHEIGHLLGLGHSSVPEAIMWPSIYSGTTKGLNDDDIQGIRALYS